MNLTEVWADEAGTSHFREIEIPLAEAGEIGRLSEAVAATGLVFRETGGDYDYDWHRAPRSQYIVLLDGEIEIEVGDGERRRFCGGEILLVSDTHGRGHRTRSVDGGRRRSLFIHLD